MASDEDTVTTDYSDDGITVNCDPKVDYIGRDGQYGSQNIEHCENYDKKALNIAEELNYLNKYGNIPIPGLNSENRNTAFIIEELANLTNPINMLVQQQLTTNAKSTTKTDVFLDNHENCENSSDEEEADDIPHHEEDKVLKLEIELRHLKSRVVTLESIIEKLTSSDEKMRQFRRTLSLRQEVCSKHTNMKGDSQNKLKKEDTPLHKHIQLSPCDYICNKCVMRSRSIE